MFSSALAVVIACAALAASQADIPSVMRDRDDPSFWIAADKAVRSDGSLDREAMGRFGANIENHLSRLPELRDKAAKRNRNRATQQAKWPELEGCEFFLGSAPEHFEPTSSLADLTSHAQFIVSGRVVAIRQGFLGGSPGSLLLLHADYLKGEPARETYLFYPLARIRTNEGFVCARPLGNFVPPSAGDRVLLFSMTDPHHLDDRIVFEIDPSRELVHEPQKSSLQIPAALTPLTSPAGPRFEDVLGAVRKSLAVSVTAVQ